MKLLWVKAGGVVPLDTGGKIRSYQILKELARKHQVTLYTYYAEHPNDAHPALDGQFARVICRPIKLAVPRSIVDYARYVVRLLSSYPYSMNRYYQREIVSEVRELALAESYDVIVCDFLFPARVIPWEATCPKVLFTHNVEATIYRRQFEIARNPFWKMAAWREYRLTARAERKYLRRADHVLTVSDSDREAFLGLAEPSKITTIPTGVDVQYFQPADGPYKPNSLVFTGSMDYLPNEDAVLFFAKEILPRIRSRVSDVSLSIVGRRPSPRVQALAASGQRIQVTGRVEDVRPYIRQGALYIVPLRIGGGTRLKIFEAMAMAKAIVSTSIGAEGLSVKNGANILIADSPEDFAQGVTKLLRDPVERNRLGCAARQMVEQAYSWTAVVSHFESVLTSLAAKDYERALPQVGESKEIEARECGFTGA